VRGLSVRNQTSNGQEVPVVGADEANVHKPVSARVGRHSADPDLPIPLTGRPFYNVEEFTGSTT
jgi:hypothetical protein